MVPATPSSRGKILEPSFTLPRRPQGRHRAHEHTLPIGIEIDIEIDPDSDRDVDFDRRAGKRF
jgi:hypothetical protein